MRIKPSRRRETSCRPSPGRSCQCTSGRRRRGGGSRLGSGRRGPGPRLKDGRGERARKLNQSRAGEKKEETKGVLTGAGGTLRSIDSFDDVEQGKVVEELVVQVRIRVLFPRPLSCQLHSTNSVPRGKSERTSRCNLPLHPNSMHLLPYTPIARVAVPHDESSHFSEAS